MSTSDWTGAAAGPAEACDTAASADVIEGGAPSWHRRQLPRLRWPVAVVLGIALAAGGAAVVRTTHSADDLPSLAALRAAPAASTGLLGWAPRGQLVGDDGFVREALRTLRSSGPVDRPRTQLHLLYAGDQRVLLEGKDRNNRGVLAQVVDGEVLVDRLRQREPVALTLPAGSRLRFLVPPATKGPPGPAVVWVEDALADPAGGFRALPADATGLTEEYEPAPGDARFAVLEPRVNDVGMPAGDRLRGDGVVVAGALTPTVPTVRLTGSPWSLEGDQPPSRQWLTDAEVLGAALPTGEPVRVASLTGFGFAPGPPRRAAKTYSGGLYAVTDTAGQDYLGFVLRVGDHPLCSRVTPVSGRFADLLVVGGRCDLPAERESLAAIIVDSRPDVRSGTIEFSRAAGLRGKRLALAAGSALVDFENPAYQTVTLTAFTDRSSATFVIPSG